MTAHSTLTGADLHEPKGVESASSGTVYVANGSGSGSWSTIDSSNLNSSSIKNINKGKVYVTFPDISTAGSIFVPVSSNLRVDKITATLQGPLTTADNIITVYNGAGVSMGNMTIYAGGSAAGDLVSLTPASNNTLSANQNLKFTTNGASDGAYSVIICVDYTLT